jgi:hypothetical protein
MSIAVKKRQTETENIAEPFGQRNDDDAAMYSMTMLSSELRVMEDSWKHEWAMSVGFFRNISKLSALTFNIDT